MGINISLYGAGAFGLSAFYAECGWRACCYQRAVRLRLTAFTLTLSIGPSRRRLVVGGVGLAAPGALFGGAFCAIRTEHRRAHFEGLSGAVYGLSANRGHLRLMPSGVAGVFRAIICRFTQHRSNKIR